MSVHAVNAVTALTAQHSDQFIAINPVEINVLEQQIDAALVLQPQAIKIGLLCNVEQVALLARKLEYIDAPIIYDPVMSSSSGQLFVDELTLEAISRLLLPLCDCLTPNLPEASRFLAQPVLTAEQRGSAAKALSAMGSAWVVVKGGHASGAEVYDGCYHRDSGFRLTSERVTTEHNRGTGCALSSCIASALASGYQIRDAIIIARMAVQQGLQSGYGVHKQRGPIAIAGFPVRGWPRLTTASDENWPQGLAFPPCSLPSGTDQSGAIQPGTVQQSILPDESSSMLAQQPALGIYPVVDSVQLLQQLLPLGVTTAQLRIKHLQATELAAEVSAAVALARQYGCRLFINDHWQLAIEQGAYGVHLGQQDLNSADLKQIHRAGLRLGISSHSHYEVARAMTFQPSYLACGPVFATQSKIMPWIPHGIAGLRYWQQSLDCPIVAIGGISQDNIVAVAATGVSGIAMIGAITNAADPAVSCRQLMASMDRTVAV
jgi:hydroxymethylpyrimidine kinase/phosphomethylpyrimidine kinase/thiamine-phosphate diphosphorylase